MGGCNFGEFRRKYLYFDLFDFKLKYLHILTSNTISYRCSQPSRKPVLKALIRRPGNLVN